MEQTALRYRLRKSLRSFIRERESANMQGLKLRVRKLRIAEKEILQVRQLCNLRHDLVAERMASPANRDSDDQLAIIDTQDMPCLFQGRSGYFFIGSGRSFLSGGDIVFVRLGLIGSRSGDKHE